MPRVVPAEADGVPVMAKALTVPAKSVVRSKFSVPAKVKSTSVFRVTSEPVSVIDESPNEFAPVNLAIVLLVPETVP